MTRAEAQRKMGALSADEEKWPGRWKEAAWWTG